MPTQSDDASSLILGNDFFSHTIERHAIEVFLAIQLYFSKIEAHHSRIITCSEEYIALSFIPFPSSTIHRIILMTEHDSLVQ